MKKISLLLIAVLLGSFNLSYAVKEIKVSPDVQYGVKYYKAANYVGALQHLEKALKTNPNDQLAQYYLANCYVKIGKKEKAKEAYDKVIKANQIPGLVKYADVALKCLESEQNCAAAKASMGAKDEEMERFIKSGQFMATDGSKAARPGDLTVIQNKINNGEEINFSDLRYLNDATNSNPMAETNQIAAAAQIPTDAEIASAVKTLAKVGFNPVNYNYANNNSGMMSFLENGYQSGSKMNPQLMQAMMMTQLMPDFSSANTRGF